MESQSLFSVYRTSSGIIDSLDGNNDPMFITTSCKDALAVAQSSMGSLTVQASVWDPDPEFPLDLIMVDCFQVYP